MKKLIIFSLICAVCIFMTIAFLRKPAQTVPQTNIQTRTVTKTEHVGKPKSPKSDFVLKDLNSYIVSNDPIQNRKILTKKIGQNYIADILNGGFVIRWNEATFPLKIYNEKCPECPAYYNDELINAFNTWSSSTNGFFKFVFVNDSSVADIFIKFVDSGNRVCINNYGLSGAQRFSYSGDLLTYAGIDFYKTDCTSKFYTKDMFYNSALHEIGHILGLNGHSPNKTDIMYPHNTGLNIKISQTDINTMKILYSSLPDLTNREFSQEQKQYLIPVEKIWGTLSARLKK